ncbi:hypothetical protein G9A89_002142 [Geosiphon pyriformis]|nr:hypothetical protein G9A89_002142 [Geosiphon pyriformis]
MTKKKRNIREKVFVESDEETPAVDPTPRQSHLLVNSRLSFMDEIIDEDSTPSKYSIKANTRRLQPSDSNQWETSAETKKVSLIPGIRDQNKNISYNMDHQVLNSARQNIYMRRTEERGRGIFAAELIKPGKLIMEEKPYAAVVDDKNLDKICSCCFNQAKRLMRCSSCNMTHYCSTQCQKEDWKYHKDECQTVNKVKRQPPASIRIICRILRKRSKEPQSFSAIESLQTSREKFKNKEIETFAQLSLLTRECVSPAEILGGGEMIDLFCRLTCNSFSILDEEMIGIGVGVYSEIALINHSCLPNCLAIFEGSKVMIRSIRSIQKDEEIFITYTDLGLPTVERRKELNQRYFFVCKCELCAAYDKKENFDPRGALKCQTKGCLGAIESPGTLDPQEEYSVKCNSCENLVEYDLADVERQIQDASDLYDKGFSYENKDESKAIFYIEKAFNIQKQLLHIGNHQIIKTRKSLVQIQSRKHEWLSAMSHSLELVKAYQHLFSEFHPLIGIQLLVSARIMLCLHQDEDGIRCLKDSLKILEISHGYQHTLTKKVAMSLRELERDISLRNQLGKSVI